MAKLRKVKLQFTTISEIKPACITFSTHWQSIPISPNISIRNILSACHGPGAVQEASHDP